MRFSLLGPLAVRDGTGGRVPVAGPRLRVLLAALLLHANLPVPSGELAEMVWDGSPPSGAVATLRSYVRRLRGVIDPGGSRLAASGHGYVLHVGPAELDVLEFEELCRDTRAAMRAGGWADASATAVRALALWRAAPLQDVPAESLREQFVPRLDRLRLQALEDRFDAGIRLGHHQELIPELLDATARHPLRERFGAQLMLALAGTGQRAEALRAYQQVRTLLVDELGIEPGPELRDVHRRILAADADPARPADPPARDEPPVRPEPGAPAAPEAGPTVLTGGPAQLPADVADFTGRRAQAAYLSCALSRDDLASGPGMVRVAVVTGVAGVGKTTLALHVAHQVRDLFPDGQLYAHLSGASRQPAVPGEVVARFLRDLGVDGDKVPAGEEERAALYRSRLAGRKVLVLLDDARDAAQVRPLLPGSGTCAVLVTTRNRTPSLVSTGFAELAALPEPEARGLFTRIVGDTRPAGEPEATAEILAACAGLPLAIRICGARLATRRQWRVATMAARLRDEQRRLDELQIGDLETRASFQVSYDSLDAGGHQVDPARVFRLLGLWPGQQISLSAAAALTGERAEDLTGTLEALVDANLLESPEPDWYQLHNLLHLFANERAQAEETAADRGEAVQRLLRWYLVTATAASDVVAPNRYRLPGDEPPPADPSLDSVSGALAWYDREHASVITATRQAAAAGLHEVAWRLPTVVFPLFARRHNFADCITAHRVALDSAQTDRSRPGQAWALHNLGYALAQIGDPAAFGCLLEASGLREQGHDLPGQAQVAISLAEAHYKLHGAQAAYDQSLRGLDLVRRAGVPALLGIGLNNHGEHCRVLGRYDEASASLMEALGIWSAIGGGNGHGHVVENLGRIELESGQFQAAIASLSQAYEIQLAQGHLLGQAQALRYLGEAQRRAGQTRPARDSFEAALALFTDLNAAAEVADLRSALAFLT
jgi:DNA-binding SARP family transcriptional activator/tetratricopeptide (TPR) repeat protein